MGHTSILPAKNKYLGGLFFKTRSESIYNFAKNMGRIFREFGKKTPQRIKRKIKRLEAEKSFMNAVRRR